MAHHPTLLAAASALTLLACLPAHAQSLRLGLASEPTSIDPHYHELGPNNALAQHLFDGLVGQDARQRVQPELATAWERQDDTTWVFRLRPGVTFSDGSAFDAADVVFTFCRILNSGSPTASFNDPILSMASVETPDPLTVVIRTKAPNPLLLVDLAGLAIVSDGIAEHGMLTFDPARKCGVTGAWPTTDQFNDGSKAIGTGPYVLKSYVKGDRIELSANPRHWGPKPHWQTVTSRAIPSDGPRLAALLAGDVDLVENPASRDLARLKDNAGFAHVITPSNRVIFLQLDVARAPGESPSLKVEGTKNPFADARVREAMSLAIDRNAIVQRIMDGVATPAAQFLPNGMFGALAEPKPLAYDPARAKALLAEAGFAKGFEVTLATPNDRYINDERIAQAVAQFLTQVGIRTNVEAMTRSVFFARRAKREFSFSLGGWGSGTGEASSFLRAFVTTTNKDMGIGGSNYGGWSDPELDAVFVRALSTMDDATREQLLQQSVARTMQQLPLLPLHFESSIWAFKKGLTYEGRADQYTLAMGVKPAG